LKYYVIQEANDLRVHENKALRRIVGPERGEEPGRHGKLYQEVLYNMRS
jgi:hypothetical protein